MTDHAAAVEAYNAGAAEGYKRGYEEGRATLRAQHAALVKLLNEFGESEDPYANDLVANLLATLGEPEGP